MPMDDIAITQLFDHRAKLLAYVRTKISDAALAEDLLQDSLLKALRATPDLREEEKLVPWFYRILNNAIIDLYRHRQSKVDALDAYALELDSLPDAEEETALCACFRELLPTLKPEYGELIEKLDLAAGDTAQVAEELGIKSNNLKVRRHRARQALRQRLEETCRLCAKHGCLDCTCAGEKN